MKNKINKCINDAYESYADFSSSKAVTLLEDLFDSEILSFISFFRENYSTMERWDYGELDSNFWRRKDITDEVLDVREIYKLWKTN